MVHMDLDPLFHIDKYDIILFDNSVLRRRYMILAKRRYLDELAIREATRAADVTFVISVNDKQGKQYQTRLFQIRLD